MNSKTVFNLRWWRIDAAGLGACALITGLAYLAVVRPVWLAQAESDRLVPILSRKQEDLRSARAALAKLREDLEDTRAQVQDLPLRLESSTQVNSRLARLADLASRSGLELHQMLPDQTHTGARYDTVPIKLSGAGDYRKVTRFMRDVHEQFADIAIVGFDLSAGRAGQGQARFDIGLAWYTIPALGNAEN